MGKSSKCVAFAALSVVLLGGSRAKADDEDKLAKAPAAVQATVKKIVGDGKLEGFDNEQVDGKPAFDVDFSLKGGSYAMLVAESGDVIQREAEVNLAVVPQAVIDAGAKAHGDGKIAEASIITRGDQMFYELEIKVGNDEHDVEINAGGKVLADTVAKPEAADPADKKDKDEEKGGAEKKD